LLADLFFGVLPNPDAQTLQLRKSIAEALAVQVGALLQSDDPTTLQRTLDGVATRTEGVRSLALRRAGGHIALQAGDHGRWWQTGGGDTSNAEQITVPLTSSGLPWGSFEVGFKADTRNPVWRLLTRPLVVTLLFLCTVGTLVFGLYMRRALQHLDPAAVIPQRVLGVFDVISEGVVVLDARGCVMLANKAFRELHPDAASVATGNALSTLPWLTASLPSDLGQHPWVRAMSTRASSAGDTIELGGGNAEAPQLVINCAPITDPAGNVRGCIVSFADVSKLQRVNQALHEAVTALTASKEALQQQNVELECLATHDPMTGCLNRRAFFTAFEPLLARSRTEGMALSCVMVDIDHCKAVNDAHGQEVGNVLIQVVAKKLIESTRPTDLVCRYGGEAFCIVLPGLESAEARVFAERVRESIERECGPGVREVKDLRITASFGLDMLSHEVESASALIDRADQALYEAKRSGGNRVNTFGAPGRAPAPEAGQADALESCLPPAAFQRRFDKLLRSAQVRGAVIGAIKFALDPYQALLAGHGPQAADAALRTVAGILRECVRSNDLLVRFDADHFGVIAPDLEIQAALQLAERIRSRVEAESTHASRDAAPRLSVSAGVDSLPANASGAPTLIERAGNALLRARRDGPNRVARFEADVVAGERSDVAPLPQPSALLQS
jgi:diguanylate cyclase (GGDEF)-like protein